MNDTTKTCSKCGNVYPATTEYFCRHKSNKDGLNYWCKACVAEYTHQYKQANRDKLVEKNREYYLANRDKISEKLREYYQANPDKKRESTRKYNQINSKKKRESQYRYKQENRDKIRDKNREYSQANPDRNRIRQSRRRARKQALPATFTHEQWLTCLKYFNYTCAVCGTEFGDSTPHADHWIPLNSDKCTGTIASNMVCLCGNCNWSKHDKMPDVWLKQKYDIQETSEILQRVDAYFQFINNLK